MNKMKLSYRKSEEYLINTTRKIYTDTMAKCKELAPKTMVSLKTWFSVPDDMMYLVSYAMDDVPVDSDEDTGESVYDTEREMCDLVGILRNSYAMCTRVAEAVAEDEGVELNKKAICARLPRIIEHNRPRAVKSYGYTLTSENVTEILWYAALDSIVETIDSAVAFA